MLGVGVPAPACVCPPANNHAVGGVRRCRSHNLVLAVVTDLGFLLLLPDLLWWLRIGISCGAGVRLIGHLILWWCAVSSSRLVGGVGGGSDATGYIFVAYICHAHVGT